MRLAKSALILCGLLLAAASARAEDSVTLRYWVGGDPASPNGIAAREQIKKFEAAHPNIKVESQDISYGALHDKLVTAVAGGDAPDLSWGLSEWFGEFSRMGALADLQPFADQWADKAEIYPNVIQALTIDGKLRAVPHYVGLRALLWHEDMLKQAGITAPPKTWAELIEMAPKIEQATGKKAFGIAGTGVRAPQELMMFLAQEGLAIADRGADGKYRNTWADDPARMEKAAGVFTFYRTLLDKGIISPQAAGWGYEEEDTNFALGQYAMVINGSWMEGRARQYPDTMKDVRIAPPIYGDKPATFFEITPILVFKASKHPKEAWELASFIAGKQYQEAAYPTYSVRKDVVSTSQWGKSFTDLASIGVFYPPVAMGQITKEMQDSIGHVLLEKQDPAAAAKNLSTSINRALKRSGELGTD